MSLLLVVRFCEGSSLQQEPNRNQKLEPSEPFFPGTINGTGTAGTVFSGTETGTATAPFC